MRLFCVAVTISAFLTSACCFAQSDEPLTSGTQSPRSLEPGWARFEPSASQQYRTDKARDRRLHSESIIRYYDAIGYNFAQPTMNSGFYNVPLAPQARYIWRRGYVVLPGSIY
ncbi:hypothetical protein SH449x_003060 [Pirellulaceae bacterium SH449]